MRTTLLLTCAATLAITGCGGAQPPDFRDLDQLELESTGRPDGGEAGQDDEARDPDEKARIDSMLASESSAAPTEPAAPAVQVPWQFDGSSDSAEPVDEAAKQATNAANLPQWVQDPMTTVTDRERRMAALSVATYGKRGAELDRVLAERGMDRAQAVAEYRQLADDHPRGGPYTEQMYEYQSWAVQGETIPSF